MKKGVIYLIPTALGDTLNPKHIIPRSTFDIANKIDLFVVENEKKARVYLEKLGIDKTKSKFMLLNKYTDKHLLSSLLHPVLEGKDIGIMSNAGYPSVADPGADLIFLAHIKEIKIIPLIGPSSILLALIASGFNGQNFTFNGYLPKKRKERIRRLKEFEKLSKKLNQTQIFIEAPHRNQELINDIISCCNKTTQLCIASDITLTTEFIKSKPVHAWKKSVPNIHKHPSVFLIYA
jgi:16S rRNA (cytidine1402-2'-O)-methyltransferase